MPDDRLRSALGFAMKAGRVRSGDLAAEKTLKSGRARLAIVDANASEATLARWTAMCRTAGVPLIRATDMGMAIGREAHMVACVTDDGFANMIMRSYKDIES